MILTSAYEFSSRHSNKIKDRPTDDAVLSNVSINKNAPLGHMIHITDHHNIITSL